MSMTQISTVLFDLGNVLAYIDFNAFWRDLGFFQIEKIILFKDEYTALTLQYETGNITTDHYLNELRIVFKNKYTTTQLEQAFSHIIQQPVEGMADIVKHVAVRYHTALVSNTNEIHYNLSLKKFEAMQILQKQYLSYQLHTMKPAQDFYLAIIHDQNILPSKMLFIDDLTENVQAAQTAGMQAILFESVAQVKKELKKIDIL